VLYWHKIELEAELKHQAFEWDSGAFKTLNRELILGVLSIFANKNTSVYFLLEK